MLNRWVSSLNSPLRDNVRLGIFCLYVFENVYANVYASVCLRARTMLSFLCILKSTRTNACTYTQTHTHAHTNNSRTPLLAFIAPRVIQNDATRVEIVVPLSWRTKNSWNTLFFAAIAAGCDLTGGFKAFELAPSRNVGVLYKDMAISFLRRCDDDLHLVSIDQEKVAQGIEEAVRTKQRVNVAVEVNGYVYSYSKTEPVVTAKMTLSLKQHSQSK